MKFNPFKPNSIATSGMFAGRVSEIRDIDRGFFQTKNGNPWHFLVHGERGIGKSSLMLFSEFIANGGAPSLETDIEYKFLTVFVEVTPSMKLKDLVSSIEVELKSVIRDRQATQKVFLSVWDFCKDFEVCGIKYNGVSAEPMELIPELARFCSKISKDLGEEIDGIYIFIDEADNASAETRIGEFIKVFTERLTRASCNNVGLGVSGISNVYEKLKDSHESSVRILNSLKLEPLEHHERIAVVKQGLDEGNQKSSKNTEITAEAENWIAKFSEGFPHFIQQYAFSSFETDVDFMIDIQDVLHGAYRENGALAQLGERYFNDMYNLRINSDEYRIVLNAMADHDQTYISRKDIMERTGLKKTTLDNAIRSLKQKGIIIANVNKMGYYKLPNDSFGAWIRAQAKIDQANEQKSF